MSSKSFVLKLGGHLLFIKPNSFIEYCKVLDEALNETKRLHVVVGGGEKAREYIEIARNLGLNEALLDKVGIMVSHINAFLIYSYLSKEHEVILAKNWHEILSALNSSKSIITGGLIPSISTTTVACLLAEVSNSMLLYATDVEGVYDKDPKKEPNAKFYKEIEIDELINVMSSSQDFRAGKYKLFDMHALNIMKRSRIPVRVFNGIKAENIIKAIKNENIGTIVYYK